MPAAYFALTPYEYVWKNLLEVCGPELASNLIDEALTRLQTFLPRFVSATREGTSTWIVVVHPQLPDDPSAIASWAISLERAVSAEPYVVPQIGGHLFLPLPCAGVVATSPSEPHESGVTRAKRAVVDVRRNWAALAWHGTMETSRLVLYSGTANIGGDDSCEIQVGVVDRAVARVEQTGHHIGIGPVGASPSRVLLHGRPLRPQRFKVAILFIPPERRGQEPSIIFLFDSASRAVHFRTRDSLADEQWAHVALARAGLAASSTPLSAPYGLILLVTREKSEVVERWRKLIVSVEIPRGKRDVSFTPDGLAIVMEASPSDIDDYAESLREAFFEEAVVVVSMRPLPNELPASILERARESAREMMSSR